MAKKVVREIFAWFVATSISLGLSGAIISYSINTALAVIGILDILFNMFLALFGTIWLLISAILFYNIFRIIRRYALLPSPYAKLREFDDEEVVRLIKDVVSLYRGYSWYVIFVGALLTIAGGVGVVLAVKEYITGGMYIGLFKFATTTIYLFYGILALYLEKRTVCRRLAKAKQLEDTLSKLIN